MDLGNGLVSFMLAVDFLDDVVGEAYRQGTIPDRIEAGDIPYPGVGLRNLTVLLDPPALTTIDDPFQLLLVLTGSLELRAAGESSGPVTETRPLDLRIRADLRERTNEDGDPVLFLDPAGAEPPVVPAELEPLIGLVLELGPLADILGRLELPVYADLIDAAAKTLFPGDGAPGAPPNDAWARRADLVPGGDGTVPMIMAVIGPPGATLSQTETTSPIAAGNALAIAYDDNFLNPVLAAGAAEQVGREIEGARITRLSLVMDDSAIRVDGEAEKSGATISFTGPVTLRFVRAGNMLLTDAEGVEVDVDLPWYLWFGLALGFVFGGPIVGSVILGNVVFPALDDAAQAPDAVQGGLVSTLNGELVRLVEALQKLDSFAGVQGYLITDSADVSDGTIAIFAEVIVESFETEIVDARRYPSYWFQKYDSPFQEFDLGNGRSYPAHNVAELLKAGLVTIPGYHGVNGRTRKFVRANPDESDVNNLDARFPGTHSPSG